MNLETIQALESALEVTPTNEMLRLQIARGYYNLYDYENAKKHFNILLQQTQKATYKVDLAMCYYQLKNYSAGLIICEELGEKYVSEPFASVYIKLLFHDNQIEEAIRKYHTFQDTMEHWQDDEIEQMLKIPSIDIDEDTVSYNPFFEKPTINFTHVGGMQVVKDEVKMKIIQPLQNPELFKAFGKKAGGGILLYGPPGCGKTFISKATAGEIQSKFMTIELQEILDMWLGNSEKKLHEKFEIARANKPCVIFIDEIDALGSKRNDLKQSAGRNLINQFLKELDGIDSDNEGLLILGATNSPWHMDSAFLRPGRFDSIIFIPPPDLNARIEIIELMLREKPCNTIDIKAIATKSEGFSGADLKLLIDLTTEDKLRDSMRSGKIENIDTKTILNQINKVRPSTREWFNTAKNYAMYSNTSGMYDDILKYLKI